ncbi:7827_t:CDS:2 [Dentiscutata heterogama]|uniref:7827_t:CDS:1 n=1 Tax=Dentiscutata heterogama TaxID=1316150 RepID=A0ACA9MXM5_9GLOM|nr:7827_t:CDS:2 [Dentiscutata heterogama]
MAEICELVISQKGNPKLVVNGYLMSECCKGQAITTFLDNLHYLKKFVKHNNHAPQADRSKVAKVIACIKHQAHETRDTPS